jgi:hypothetical protein
MKRFQHHLLMATALSLLLLAACKTKEKAEEKPPVIPVETFFKNPENFGWQISPDGEYISYLSPYKGHTNVFVRKITDSTGIPVTSDSVRNIYNYSWKGNRILYLQDIGGDENYQLFSVGLDGKDLKPLTPFPKVRTTIFDNLRYVPGKETLAFLTPIASILKPAKQKCFIRMTETLMAGIPTIPG